jgi:hypothetical protein
LRISNSACLNEKSNPGNSLAILSASTDALSAVVADVANASGAFIDSTFENVLRRFKTKAETTELIRDSSPTPNVATSSGFETVDLFVGELCRA